jgi:Cys-tRNA(Pro)/Cys-tRNA(Cys) deacylase
MAKARVEKTNAIRSLEARKVAFEALEYDPAIHSAVEVAETLGIPPDRVYKTLVVLRDAPGARPLLVMIAGNRELDPRTLARSLGEKSVRMAPQREAERLTGLLVGGIGALALMGRNFESCIDRVALQLDWILVNGGRRGLNLRIQVEDLVRLTAARPVEVTAD